MRVLDQDLSNIIHESIDRMLATREEASEIEETFSHLDIEFETQDVTLFFGYSYKNGFLGFSDCRIYQLPNANVFEYYLFKGISELPFEKTFPSFSGERKYSAKIITIKK